MVCEFAVRLGPKFSETVKGKLSVGAKIIKKGGRENIFKDIFGVMNGEKLLKASQCYLSTSAGPIAGILFISTEKVAFCSERSITVQSCSGALIRTLYKVNNIKIQLLSRRVSFTEWTFQGFRYWIYLNSIIDHPNHEFIMCWIIILIAAGFYSCEEDKRS